MSRPESPSDRPVRRRRLLVGAATAVVVVLLAAAALLLAGSSGDEPAAAAPAATSPSGAASPTTGGTAASSSESSPAATSPGDAGALPPRLPAVGLDQQAAVGDGVSASLVALDAVQGTAHGPGNIAGPALRVTVRMVNGTSAPIELDGVSIELTYGRADAPASPLDDPSAAPFTGTLAPGGSAEGTYVFTVPEDQRQVVTVAVGYRAGAPFMVFTGSAG